VFDWEVPLGVELVYYAQADGGPIAESPPITITDSRDWLVDLARPTNSFPVLVEALPELDFEGPVEVHRVLDRRDPVLTTAAMWTPAGTLAVITGTRLERDRAREIIGSGVAFLLRTMPKEGVGNIYLGATAMREQRISRLAIHWDRRFSIDVVQVARPDPALYVPLPPLTYADRSEMFATYADTTATGRSYQDVAYTFPPDRIDPTPGWPPDDV
jgi:hypothetical protein